MQENIPSNASEPLSKQVLCRALWMSTMHKAIAHKNHRTLCNQAPIVGWNIILGLEFVTPQQAVQLI
jgi:hypothetical protein